MSAWLSFLGGYAKGANEEIDKQREKEEQYIQDRMKMAAATRLQKQKEAENQRAELKASLGKLSTYENFKNADQAEQIALLGNAELREQWLKNPTQPISSVIVPNKEKLSQYKSTQDYIDRVVAKPKAVDEQTMSAFQQPRSVFGATTGTNMEGLAQNAARFGMKPEEALGWEQGAVEMPDGTDFGTIKNEALAPDTFEGMFAEVEKKGAAAFKAKDPAAMKAAQEEAMAIKAAAAAYAAEKKVDIDNEINAVAVAASKVDPKSPEYKQLMQKKARLEMIKRHGVPQKGEGGGDGDKLSQSGFARAMSNGGVKALQEFLGNEAPKGQYIIPPTTPEGQPTIAFDKLNKERQDAARAIVQKSQLATAMIQLRGQPPKTRQDIAALQEVGIYDLYMKQVSGETPSAAPTVTPPPKPAVTQPAKPATGGKTKRPVSRAQIETNIDKQYVKGSKDWQREYDANKAMMIGAGYTVID